MLLSAIPFFSWIGKYYVYSKVPPVSKTMQEPRNVIWDGKKYFQFVHLKMKRILKQVSFDVKHLKHKSNQLYEKNFSGFFLHNGIDETKWKKSTYSNQKNDYFFKEITKLSHDFLKFTQNILWRIIQAIE